MMVSPLHWKVAPSTQLITVLPVTGAGSGAGEGGVGVGAGAGEGAGEGEGEGEGLGDGAGAGGGAVAMGVDPPPPPPPQADRMAAVMRAGAKWRAQERGDCMRVLHLVPPSRDTERWLLDFGRGTCCAG